MRDGAGNSVSLNQIMYILISRGEDLVVSLYICILSLTVLPLYDLCTLISAEKREIDGDKQRLVAIIEAEIISALMASGVSYNVPLVLVTIQKRTRWAVSGIWVI